MVHAYQLEPLRKALLVTLEQMGKLEFTRRVHLHCENPGWKALINKVLAQRLYQMKSARPSSRTG